MPADRPIGRSPFSNPAGRAHSGIPRRRRQEAILAYLLLLPSALVLGLFGFAPLVNAVLLSFREWRNTPGPFVGWANYQRAFTQEPEFWQSLGVTVWYVLGTVPVTLVVGYLLAEMLHTRLRGLAVYRTLFFLPYIVSPVAAAAVWKWILNPTFGVANAAVAPLGVRPQWLLEEQGVFRLAGSALHVDLPGWAAGPSLALVSIMGVSIWHGLGFAVVVLLAGLSAVPSGSIEAARLDGAGGWRLIRDVKIPLLSPTLFFLLVVFTIRAFQTFTQLYVMSIDGRGGPAGTTRNITLYIFESFNVNAPRLGPGYGSAVAVILFLIILALTLLQFRVLGHRVHYEQ